MYGVPAWYIILQQSQDVDGQSTSVHRLCTRSVTDTCTLGLCSKPGAKEIVLLIVAPALKGLRIDTLSNMICREPGSEGQTGGMLVAVRPAVNACDLHDIIWDP